MTSLEARVDAVRRFTRFYTLYAGVLHRRLLSSPYSLTEARVIYELAHHETARASELAAELALDSGYLSRILKGFEKHGLIETRSSEDDGRARLLSLSAAGKAVFAELNARSRAETAARLERLSEAEQAEVVEAMTRIEARLKAPSPRRVPYILRPHRPGDMGWIIHRQAVLYSAEYGWDESFEALVSRIAADFIDNFAPPREYCWIAEMDGEIVGSAFVVRESDAVAKLRMVYVELKARGLGIGKRLVDEAVRFSRQQGYGSLTLWTNDILVAARRLYEAAGFRLVKEEAHHSFGKDLVGQNWTLDLARSDDAGRA